VIGRTGDRPTDYTLPLLAALVLLGIAFALRELRRRRD
jgi:MYXO-CTERM domain-containing protein